MEMLERDAGIICANLLRKGYLKKSCLPTLELDEALLHQVQERLAQVGMELVWNSYSPYYAVRFTRNIQDTIDESNNLGLKNNEVAMLVILWSKLILPKRLVVEDGSGGNKGKEVATVKPPVQTSAMPPAAQAAAQPAATSSPDTLLAGTTEPTSLPDSAPAEKVKSAPSPDKLTVKISELQAEFGRHFGSKTTFRALLTRLSNLQFIQIHDEILSEGILLDLLIDGYQMGQELKKSALAFKLAGIAEEEEEPVDDEEEEEEAAEPDKEEETGKA